MKNEMFYTLYGEAVQETDKDAFVSDWSLSSIWGDAEDADIPQERIDVLGEMWDAAHRTIKDVASASGKSVRQLAMKYAIPRRTAGDWSAGVSMPSAYILLMMQICEGIYKHP